MEYMPIGDLYSYIHLRGNVIPPPSIFNIIVDISNGIAKLHEFGLHGDIKSPNILLSSDLRAKISDFGTARLRIMSISKQSHYEGGYYATGTL